MTGAVNVTLTPAKWVLATSVTVTESGVLKAFWIWADCEMGLSAVTVLAWTWRYPGAYGE